MDGGATSSGTVERVCSSRWTPTKEQINMLECVYKQGIRTPTADQIQRITNRLNTYGKIQAKNVFYWFQNHKARQRQKQKQRIILLQNPSSSSHPLTTTTTSYKFVTQINGFGIGFNKFAANNIPAAQSTSTSVEVLPLFPLEPSGGTLRDQRTTSGAGAGTIVHEEYSCSYEKPYFDFFSINEGKRSNLE